LYPSPENRAPDAAGRIAAALLMRRIEDPKSSGLDISGTRLARLLSKPSYKILHDEFIANEGGWTSTFLESQGPEEFDRRIKDRLADARRVSQLVDFRFRAAMHHPDLKCHVSAAIDFLVRHRKEREPRTYWDLWAGLNRSAVVNYVIEQNNLSMMRPPPTADADLLLGALRRPAIGIADFKKLLGQCAFIDERLGSDTISPAGRHVVIETRPLTERELGVASTYKYDHLSDSKKDKSTAILPDQWPDRHGSRRTSVD
jgi:hypothetical protein